MVGKIVQAAVWSVRAESPVLQFPPGRRRPECVDLGVRQLTQNGDPIRDGAIVKTVRVASPWRCCLGVGFSLENTQQERGTHRIFVADALEPRWEGLITLWSGADRPDARAFVHTGAMRSRSLTRSTTAESINCRPF